MKRAVAFLPLISVALLSVFAAGCTKTAEEKTSAPLGPTIELMPQERSVTLGPSLEPAKTFELPLPPAPDAQTPAPAAEVPRVLAYPALPSSMQEALNEIKTKYKVPVSGNYRAQDIKKLWYAVRLFRPCQTRGVYVVFYNRGGGGVAGLYEWGGSRSKISIYSPGFHTILHELCHHITLFPWNRKSKNIAGKTMQMCRSGYRYLRSAVPSSYSQTNGAEMQAEFFSFFAEKWFKIGQPYCYRTFNPPRAVKNQAKLIYVDNYS